MGVGDKSPVQPSSADLVQQTVAEPNQQSSQGEKGQDVEKHGQVCVHAYILSFSPSKPLFF